MLHNPCLAVTVYNRNNTEKKNNNNNENKNKKCSEGDRVREKASALFKRGYSTYKLVRATISSLSMHANSTGPHLTADIHVILSSGRGRLGCEIGNKFSPINPLWLKSWLNFFIFFSLHLNSFCANLSCRWMDGNARNSFFILFYFISIAWRYWAC